MPLTLLLGRTDIAELLTVDDCLAAVESAVRAHVAAQTLPPAIHVKAAGLVERQLPGQPRTEWAAGLPGRGRAVRCRRLVGDLADTHAR